MGKEDMHTKQQSKSSAGLTTPKKDKSQSIQSNRYSSRTRKNKEKPLYYKALEDVMKVMIGILIVIFILLIFTVFINLFSIIIIRVITVLASVSSAGIVAVVKIIGKRKEINEELKDLVELTDEIGIIVKEKCKTSYLVKGVCITVIIPFVVALSISCSDFRTFAVSEVNRGWEKVINWFDRLPSDEDAFEEEVLSYPPEMSFIIGNYDYSDKITQELVSEAYFFSQDNLIEHLKSIYNSKESLEKRSEYYEAQNAFDSFSNDVKAGEAYKVLYGQNEEWYSKLPNEEELHSVIKLQEEKAELYPSYLIYKRLSNNYQMLALEYDDQYANKDTIKYFYMMSIKNDIKSIEYATKKEELYAAIDRILTRFNDILLSCDYDEEEEFYLKSLLNNF